MFKKSASECVFGRRWTFAGRNWRTQRFGYEKLESFEREHELKKDRRADTKSKCRVFKRWGKKKKKKRRLAKWNKMHSVEKLTSIYCIYIQGIKKRNTGGSKRWDVQSVHVSGSHVRDSTSLASMHFDLLTFTSECVISTHWLPDLWSRHIITAPHCFWIWDFYFTKLLRTAIRPLLSF